jgi:hypothetical protein
MTHSLLVTICLLAAAQGTTVPPKGADTLPFGPGEELIFDVHSSRFGRIGEASMRVSGPETVRGRQTYLLSFDFSAKVLLFRVSDRTRSWFDPTTGGSLRYTKRERSPLTDRDEQVEIHPETQRWVEDGHTAELATAAPLDELSFLYYVRTLPLEDGDVYHVARHFDVRRNPVTIKVLGRQNLPERAALLLEGAPAVIVVELTVPDARQKEGGTRIRLLLTDDPARVPVRLETSMPMGGTMVLDLSARSIPTS